MTGKVIQFEPRKGESSEASLNISRSRWAFFVQCASEGSRLIDYRDEINSRVATAVAEILASYDHTIIEGRSSLKMDCVPLSKGDISSSDQQSSAVIIELKPSSAKRE